MLGDRDGILDDAGHAVVIYGFKDHLYWKVKNSWNKDWGDSGSFRLEPDAFPN
jgi:C1A family cysteine protease